MLITNLRNFLFLFLKFNVNEQRIVGEDVGTNL